MAPKIMLPVASIACVAVVLAGAFVASDAFATETLPGSPLDITVTDDLNCDVYYDIEEHGSYYADIACGTFVTVFDPVNSGSWETFGPVNVPGGPGSTTPYTLVSQTPLSGSGTTDDPYLVNTIVELGSTGLTLNQIDSYINGAEEWDTTITLESDGGIATDPLDVIVYRAADCYLEGSDSGRSVVVEGEAPMCVGGVNSDDPTRLIGFWPRTPGSRFIADEFPSFWEVIEQGLPYPDLVIAGEADNGVGLSWNLTVLPGGNTFVSLTNILSPSGTHILNLSATPDSPVAKPGSMNGYTVSASNPGLLSGDLETLSVTLPAGFIYRPGTTTGATTANPGITLLDGQQVLTWVGPFVAPQFSSTSLHFNVTVSDVECTFAIDVEGTSHRLAVVSALQTAEIEVGDFASLTAEADSASSLLGAMNGYTLNVPGFSSVCELWSYSVTLPEGFSYVSGSSVGATTSDPEISGNELTWDLSSVLLNSDCSDAAALHFNVIVGANLGMFTINANAQAVIVGTPIIGVINGAPITVKTGSTPIPGPGDSLAATGSGDPALGFGIGFGVLAIGSAMLLASTRRREPLE